MGKRFFNKWFFLATLLVVSFSAFSFMAYKEARSVCTFNCCQHTPDPKQSEDMIIDAVSRQFTSLISIQ